MLALSAIVLDLGSYQFKSFQHVNPIGFGLKDSVVTLQTCQGLVIEMSKSTISAVD